MHIAPASRRRRIRIQRIRRAGRLELRVHMAGPMMIAVPVWEGRVSPVFDSAGKVLVVAAEGGREIGRDERPLAQSHVLARAGELMKLGVDVLICGAISAPLQLALNSAGIRVHGFVCGPVDDVIAAFLDGELSKAVFRMPGCRGGRQRRHGGYDMRGESRMGFGGTRGGGGGRGRGGRMGSRMAGGPGGECVCPACGERAPHTSGQPCAQVQCPKCGAAMTRA